jgi:hypothetical protein
MAEHSDVQLADILLHTDDYVPEALEAAKAELLKRKSSVEQLVQKREELVETELKTQQRNRSPLFRRGVLISLLSFITCIVVAAVFEISGRIRSFSDFAETLSFVGLFPAAIGLLVLLKTARGVWQLKMSPPPDCSLEMLRLHGEQRQIAFGTFVFILSVTAAGVATVLLSLLLMFFAH